MNSSMGNRFFLPAALLLAGLVPGCGGGGAAEMTMSPDLSPVLPTSLCANDPRTQHYAPGMSQAGTMGLLSVKLLSNQLAPEPPGPPAIGNDTWSVQVLDKTSAPVSGATFKITPWMPDHHHGTSVTPSVTAAAQSGTYTITPLYLFMAGLWQVTLDVTTPAAVSDSVVFSFCLEN